MYYYYREIDPVLQKLSSSTVSALYDQKIVCIEDLFGLSENQILDLYGIGKKRADEILDLLHSLPFDYMDASLPANPEHNPFLGIHPVLADHIRNFYRYVNDQVFKRGIEYFSQNRVHSITLKDESGEVYQADARGTQMYKVEFSLKKNKNGNIKCTCPAFRNWGYGSSYCKHIVAAMFILAMQQRLEKYMPDEGGTHRYRQLMRSLKSAHNTTKLQSSQEITYLLENRNGQWNLYPKPIYGLIKSLNKASNYNYSYSYKNPWEQITPKTPKDRIIISHLRKRYEHDNFYGGFQENGNEVVFGDVFELLQNETLKLKHDADGTATVHVNREPFRFFLQISPHNNESETPNSGLELQFFLKKEGLSIPVNAVDIVCPDPCWVYHSGKLTKLEGSELARQFFLNIAQQQVNIPAEEIGSFMEEMFPILQDADVPVDISEDLVEGKQLEPVPRIYLSEHSNELQVEYRIAYGNHEVKGDSDQNPLLIQA
ncbi:MAG TPA: SNF2 helicase associated domain-containing protein, partial [Saprospiraceae bacterium]|nr:SNF2 helicase associated domain-containing protein [Saprospiraceae bacterium]